MGVFHCSIVIRVHFPLAFLNKERFFFFFCEASTLGACIRATSYLVDNRKNPWLAFLSAVGTDSQVDFFGISVGLIGSCESKDDVRRGAGDVFKDGRYFRTSQRHTNKALDFSASPVGMFRVVDPAY